MRRILLILSLLGLLPLNALAASPDLSQVSIVLDPGHGGRDPGAIAIHADGRLIRESDVALDVALRLENLFAQAGLGGNVTLTRRTDEYVGLSERVRISNAVHGDVFVSIHLNAAYNSTANGIETFIWGPRFATLAPTRSGSGSQVLATTVQEQLVSRLGLADRGIRQHNFAVINQQWFPFRPHHKGASAILAELGFMSNAGDLSFLTTSEGKNLAAQSLYLGILDYLQTAGYTVPEWLFGIIPAPFSPVIQAPSQASTLAPTIGSGTTTAHLNFRTGPSTEHGLIRTLPTGTNLAILEDLGGWLHVRVGQEDGFVSADWVNRNHFTLQNVNFRIGAGTNYSLIRQLSQGEALTILHRSGEWLNVQTGEEIGWVHSRYVSS